MILYHGSFVEVNTPKIIKVEKGRDFGCAFYLTPIKEQAERMAIRKHNQINKIDKNARAIVSVFEWSENVKDYNYKKFEQADLEWLEMIIKCRTNPSYKHGFDIVEGKIADDSVGETVLLCINGYIKKEDAINKLRFQRINSQIAFCNEDCLKELTFVKSYEVK